MTLPLSVVVPYAQDSAATAARFARALSGQVAQVLLAGPGALGLPGGGLAGVRVLEVAGGKGRAVRAALEHVTQDVTVLQEPDAAYRTEALARLAAPILADEADAVFGRRGTAAGLGERALGAWARLATDTRLADPLTGQRAVRTAALRGLTLTRDDAAVDAELVVQLAAQLYRLAEVPLALERAPRPPLGAQLARARTLLGYARGRDAADGAHEGYTTLERMDGAVHYNAWLGRRFRPHVGRRVLEIGAGIGTITRELEGGCELLVALEVERFYVERLRNLFRGKPHVRPYLSDVALADWRALAGERLDTIVLSNVLEHIPDDAAAVRRFADILVPGGRVVVFVPALPALHGAIDEAVGHHRRYTRASLRAVLEGNGFTLERLEWVNLAGLPGWWLNSRVLRRRAVPRLQLKLYDRVLPLVAAAEARVRLPVGMSLFAVGRKAGA